MSLNMPEHEKKIPRRSFLDLVLGASVLAWLGSMFYPVIRYLKPLPRAGPTGPTRLTRDETAKLEKDHFVIVPVSGRRVLVFQNAMEIVALDAKCTHEGCTVQYLSGDKLVWCACHNGRFDLDGRVVSGPPPRPLPRYATERLEDGGILILAEAKASE
jgi:cytochrome b6-f complex iron-sulfur subunit